MFLAGFDMGWKECRAIPERYEEFVRAGQIQAYWSVENEVDAWIKDKWIKYEQYLKMPDLNSNAIYHFGNMIGFLIALFRFHPLAVLSSQTEIIINAIKALHDKPNIQKMVKDALHHLSINHISGITNGNVHELGKVPYQRYRLINQEVFGH